MDEAEIQQPEPKISEAEIILIGLFFLLLDIIDFIPGAGDITDLIAAPMGLYYWMKGLNGIAFLVSEILDLFPGPQEIPWRTISWILVVWLDRHPKIESKLGTAIEVAGAFEGNISESEEAMTEQMGGAKRELREDVKSESQKPISESLDNEGSEFSGKKKEGKPSERSTERGNNYQEIDDDKDEDREESDDGMRMGGEISPEEEAEQEDFGLTDAALHGKDIEDREDDEFSEEKENAQEKETESARLLRERHEKAEQVKQQLQKKTRLQFA